MTRTRRDAPPDAALASTLTDRWLVVRALGLAFYLAGLTVTAALVAGGLSGVPLGRLLLYAGVAGTVAGLLAAFVALLVSHGVGRGFAAFLAPSGGSTPAVDGFSALEAMAMAGQAHQALEEFERRIAGAPEDAAVRFAAAEMYANSAIDPRRAAELFREARAIAGISARDDLYASNRLVDLYLGPLDDRGRALVELRRIADRYASTTSGRRAREALHSLKRGSAND